MACLHFLPMLTYLFYMTTTSTFAQFADQETPGKWKNACLSNGCHTHSATLFPFSLINQITQQVKNCIPNPFEATLFYNIVSFFLFLLRLQFLIQELSFGEGFFFQLVAARGRTGFYTLLRCAFKLARECAWVACILPVVEQNKRGRGNDKVEWIAELAGWSGGRLPFSLLPRIEE